MDLIRCQKCEGFEARQIAVRALWRELFFARKLSEKKASELEVEEQVIISELKDHQAMEHDHDKVYEGQLPRN